ncbi:MAG: glycosyltransferase [Bacilli bacterium]|nr:glycosyltransferase [Bacilli bacterium]
MNKCIYVSSAIDRNCINKYFKGKFDYMPHQSQKFNKLLMIGLKENNFDVTSVSIIPLNRKINKKVFIKNEEIKEDGITFKYLKFINVIFFRQISIIFNTFLKLANCVKKNKETIIFIDLLNTSSLIGLFIFKIFFRNKVIGILTDIPGFKVSKKQDNLKISLSYKILYSKVDYFIPITEDMKKIFESLKKKALVIEGMIDSSLTKNERLEKKYSKFTCLYSGTLAKIYGIENLVDAFTDERLKDIDLIIYGNGDCREKIIDLGNKHSNIIYKGSADNSVVVKEQMKASLLVNPRPTSDVYTKFSFPSKIMEYMASGTAVATTELAGIPEEYKKYLILIKDYSAKGIADLVYDLFINGIMDNNKIGKEGCLFVFDKKNNIIQVKKIIENLKNDRIIKL